MRHLKVGIIIAKANLFIIAKVGSDFFARNFRFDSSRSEFYPPNLHCIEHPASCANFLRHSHYLMVYLFRIPEKPWINETIDFAVDSLGNAILERPAYGIPECVMDANKCTFAIDSVQAVIIARQAGLEDGLRAWRTDFHWYGGTIKSYVWTVSNTLTETVNASSGKTVMIDSNSGEVLLWSSWIAIKN